MISGRTPGIPGVSVPEADRRRRLNADPLRGGTKVESSDFFPTLGEIAVTLAGFASIVVVFNRRESGTWERADVSRLRGMLASSLYAAFFAVLPVGLHRAGVSEAAAWSVSSFALSCFLMLGVVFIFRQNRSLPSESYSRPLQHFMRSSVALAALLLLLNAVPLGLTGGPAAYIFAVVLLLVLSVALLTLLENLPLRE